MLSKFRDDSFSTQYRDRIFFHSALLDFFIGLHCPCDLVIPIISYCLRRVNGEVHAFHSGHDRGDPFWVLIFGPESIARVIPCSFAF